MSFVLRDESYPPCPVTPDKAPLNWLGQERAACIKHRFFSQCRLILKAHVLQVRKHCFA